MLQTALRNKKGLTLIEVMISLVVLLLVFLALLQTALVSIDSNMTNVLRDEAVNIAEEQMNVERNTPFDNLVVGTTVSPPEPRDIRNIANFTYTVTRTVTELKTNSIRQVDINVTWDWKDRTAANEDAYTHTISGYIEEPMIYQKTVVQKTEVSRQKSEVRSRIYHGRAYGNDGCLCTRNFSRLTNIHQTFDPVQTAVQGSRD